MLRELQRHFIAALDADADLPPDGITRAGAPGYAVYRNNFLVGTRKALAIDFPVVARLVGPDCFAALCRDYRRAWPSRSGDLQHLGAHFPDFLAARFDTGPHAYLADVARLERAIDECLLAPATAPADLAALGALSPDALCTTRLRLHPAVRLLRSRWPVVAIWNAHRDGDEAAFVDLAHGAVDVVVQRSGTDIELRAVEARTFDLLAALAAGECLAQACAAGFATDADDAGRALAAVFVRGLIGSVCPPADRNHSTGVTT